MKRRVYYNSADSAALQQRQHSWPIASFARSTIVMQCHAIVQYTVKRKHFCLDRIPEITSMTGREVSHNSRTELYNQNSYNSFPSKYRLLLVLLVSVLSFQRATRNPADRQTDRQTDTYTNRLLYASWLRPPRHNN